MNLVDEYIQINHLNPKSHINCLCWKQLLSCSNQLQPSQRNEFTNKLKENLTSGLQLARDFVVLNAPDLANDPSLKLY